MGNWRGFPASFPGAVFVAFFLALVVFARPAFAQPQYCGLALVLAMDASSSVDDREYELQMDGVAAALLSPEVQEAIASVGGLYMAAFEWNGRLKQKMIFDWVFVESIREVTSIATLLARHQRNSTNSPTAIGAALGYAHRLLARVPAPCTRMVIDVSGDGANNHGITPDEAYALYDFSGIVVNGLVIKDDYRSPETFYRDPEGYYRDHVLYGPGAFLALANGYYDFEKAMKNKLLREIVPGPIGALELD